MALMTAEHELPTSEQIRSEFSEWFYSQKNATVADIEDWFIRRIAEELGENE